MGREDTRIIAQMEMLRGIFYFISIIAGGLSCIFLGNSYITGAGWFLVVIELLCFPVFIWAASRLKRSTDLGRAPEASFQLTHHWLILSRIWMVMTAIIVVGIPLAYAEFLKQRCVNEFREELRRQMK